MASLKVPYLVSKRNPDGTLRYYWQPSTVLRRQGWKPRRLSDDAIAAAQTAREINADLRAAKGIAPRLTRKEKSERGVYVIGPAAGGMVKIGIARNPAGRLRELQTGNGGMLTLWFFYRDPEISAAKIEASVHLALAAHRRAGEWFGIAAHVAATEILRAFVAARNAASSLTFGRQRADVREDGTFANAEIAAPQE